MTMMNNGEGGVYEARRGDPHGNWQRCRDSRNPYGGGGGLVSEELRAEWAQQEARSLQERPARIREEGRRKIAHLRELQAQAEQIASGAVVPYNFCGSGCHCAGCRGTGKYVDEIAIDAAKDAVATGKFLKAIRETEEFVSRNG